MGEILSNILIQVYCQAVAFNPDFMLQDPRECFYEMCSFSETKHEKYLERGLNFIYPTYKLYFIVYENLNFYQQLSRLEAF